MCFCLPAFLSGPHPYHHLSGLTRLWVQAIVYELLPYYSRSTHLSGYSKLGFLVSVLPFPLIIIWIPLLSFLWWLSPSKWLLPVKSQEINTAITLLAFFPPAFPQRLLHHGNIFMFPKFRPSCHPQIGGQGETEKWPLSLLRVVEIERIKASHGIINFDPWLRQQVFRTVSLKSFEF